MSHAFTRYTLRLFPVASLIWLCACGDSDKKSANLDRDGRDATTDRTPRDAAVSEVTDGSALRPDAALTDAAAAMLDAGYVPGSLLGDADIPPVIVPPLPVGTPLCSELETWTGRERSEAFPVAAVRLLAVAAESGTRVFLREPLAPAIHDAGAPVVPDASDEEPGSNFGDGGLGAPVASLDASVAPDASVALDADVPVDIDSGPDASVPLPTAWLLVADEDAVVTVGVTSAFDVEAGVAIDPEGLELVLVRSGRDGFALSSRSSLGSEFDAPTVGAFARINALGAQGGARFAAPVWSASGERFYVSEGQGTARALQLHLQDAYWAVELRLDYNGLGNALVTSAAADDLTVFTFDAEEGSAAAYFRDHPSLPFREPQLLAIEHPVHVDADCTTLRYAEPCTAQSECEVVSQSSQ